jgi:hypothetical protein
MDISEMVKRRKERLSLYIGISVYGLTGINASSLG